MYASHTVLCGHCGERSAPEVAYHSAPRHRHAISTAISTQAAIETQEAKTGSVLAIPALLAALAAAALAALFDSTFVSLRL